MNYKLFKEQFINCLTVAKDYEFEDNELQEYYIDYKNFWYDGVEEFAKFYLIDFTLETHGYQLKIDMKKYEIHYVSLEGAEKIVEVHAIDRDQAIRKFESQYQYDFVQMVNFIDYL